MKLKVAENHFFKMCSTSTFLEGVHSVSIFSCFLHDMSDMIPYIFINLLQKMQIIKCEQTFLL